MSGKARDNSSFLKGATHGKPGRTLTRWQKKPGIHRGLIRAGVFYPIVGIIALAIYNVHYALLLFTFCLLPIAVLVYLKGRLIFFDPFTALDAGNGKRSQHWILKNKWRRLFRMQPIPGKLTWKERKTPSLPADVIAAMGEPPKKPRYRRT
jgi:hypothetical protein